MVGIMEAVREINEQAPWGALIRLTQTIQADVEAADRDIDAIDVARSRARIASAA
jgi:hypothetical protein